MIDSRNDELDESLAKIFKLERKRYGSGINSANKPSATLLISVPIPLDLPAGSHGVKFAVERMPEDNSAHGRGYFSISPGGGGPALSTADLTVTVLPVVHSLSHSATGHGGGVEITVDGGGFSAVAADNAPFLGGRACTVFGASFTRIRCRLANAPPTSQLSALAFTDTMGGTSSTRAPLVGTAIVHRGIALSLLTKSNGIVGEFAAIEASGASHGHALAPRIPGGGGSGRLAGLSHGLKPRFCP